MTKEEIIKERLEAQHKIIKDFLSETPRYDAGYDGEMCSVNGGDYIEYKDLVELFLKMGTDVTHPRF